MYLKIGETVVQDSIEVITKNLEEKRPPKIKCFRMREISGKDYYRLRCNIFEVAIDKITVENVIDEEGRFHIHRMM